MATGWSATTPVEAAVEVVGRSNREAQPTTAATITATRAGPMRLSPGLPPLMSNLPRTANLHVRFDFLRRPRFKHRPHRPTRRGQRVGPGDPLHAGRSIPGRGRRPHEARTHRRYARRDG